MKRVQKQRKSMFKKKLWVPLFIGITIAALIGGVIAFRMFRTHKNVTTVEMSVGAPTPQNFADQNVANFVTSDSTPDVNNNRQLSAVAPLHIYYNWIGGEYAPALRMNATAADIDSAVKITPHIRGKWIAAGPNVLKFTPESDWPADTKFTVKISKSLINSDVRPNSYSATFTTPEITANVDSFNIYPDPAAPKTMIGVAIISFNYPIDTHGFNDKISLKNDGKKLDFTVKFDRFRRTAFITSAPVAITNQPQVMRLKLNRISAANGDASTKKITANTTIEAADNFFKISSLTTVAADTQDQSTRQLILLNTTTNAAANTNWPDFVDAYLLPQFKDADQDAAHKWANDEITADILNKSKKLSITPVDFATPTGVHQYAFEYDVSEQSPRYIYVRVRPGIASQGGFILKNGADAVMRVPYPEKVVKIAGSGALLSLGGDMKLGIMARGGADTAYINLYKVKSSEINHLISQTYNVFASDIEFKSWSFGAYDMSVVFQKKISFADASMKKTNYASVDLADYLDRGGTDKTGIFIIQAAPTQSQANYSDKRLILLTDLGIIRKVNLDETSVLFVSNLAAGTPAADVEISILGRNGNAVWAGRTDADGRADLPKLAWAEYKNEKEPVAIVARRGSDVSFIPYNSVGDTHVEYSKFDIDGAYASNSVPLNAFLFSDRGIYRPGEHAIIAGVVKNKSFKSLAGIPVKMEVVDTRGRTIHSDTFSLASDGMFDIKIDISNTAPIGEYSARLYSLNAKNRTQDMLGVSYFRVEEFTPDTMKITATITGASDTGWISPENLNANVSLRNLFGTAATGRTVTARAVLRPIDFTFPEYKNYIFASNFIAGSGLAENTMRAAQTYSTDIDGIITDENGIAAFPIKFDAQQIQGTYLMTLTVRGGAADTAAGVMTAITTRVSDAKYLVGYHTNSDLAYINRDALRKVDFIALDHTGNPTTATGLTQRLIKREQLTSLIKDYNDYYKYQTVTRDKIVSESAFDISPEGTTITLDTKSGGTYFLQVIDASEKVLANIEYFVASDENTDMHSDTGATLQMKLNASEYAPGDNIEISITAPYSGTGLITIERDKVYAYKWFKSKTTSSVQSITVPAGFEGTGYVNISFVRDINSRDIFTSPYAYAVAPIRADINRRKIDITLSAPDVIRDNKLAIKYQTNKDARLMIFAVNAGILQVAKYKTPNPLAHFFQKSALQVETYQILSLLLPEYKILREFAKTGGGDYDDASNEIGAALTNPFARKTNEPIAFYSGIINATADRQGSVDFDIPEYFNGAIKIFAVAANDTAVGAADIQTRVQSPIIISTSAPLMAAPHDKFNIGSVITNMTDGSGDNATAILDAVVSSNLKITGDAHSEMQIPENTEKLWSFGVLANETLGNADITINAAIQNDAGQTVANRAATTTLSIRPITTFTTDIRTGVITSKTFAIKNFHTSMYPEFATRKIFVSRTPSILAKPLYEYLTHYDYPCTEQLVSRMMPYATAPADIILGTTFNSSAKKITDAITTLRNRQNSDGSFDLWAGRSQPRDNESNAHAAYVTAYAAQFLDIAKNAGFTVPAEMNSRAIDFLRTYAGTKIQDEFDAAAHAFAIYVATQNGYVTTGYIDLFEEYANKSIKNWESKLMGAYIAASYKMLKQDDAADRLISKYASSKTDKFIFKNEFDNNVANDAIYMHLCNKYFNMNTTAPNSAISAYVNSGDYSSYTSAMIVMALLGGGTKLAADNTPAITLRADDTALDITTKSGIATATVPANATILNITCENCARDAIAYYTILQQGFPQKTQSVSDGIEITREYYDEDGNRITSATTGRQITVKIFARSKSGNDIENAVITDLMPGGFTADDISGAFDFSEIREDRILIYTNITRSGLEITYTATPTTAGEFQIPPISAASMYNPQIRAIAAAGQTFTVTNEEVQ